MMLMVLYIILYNWKSIFRIWHRVTIDRVRINSLIYRNQIWLHRHYGKTTNIEETQEGVTYFIFERPVLLFPCLLKIRMAMNLIYNISVGPYTRENVLWWLNKRFVQTVFDSAIQSKVILKKIYVYSK